MRKNFVSGLFVAAGLPSAGVILGFYIRPLLYPELKASFASVDSPAPLHMTETTMVAACHFDTDQLDRLAGRMAPLLAQQLNHSDGKADANVAATSHQRESREQEKAARALVFSNAAQMVDRMIASHHVSHEGLADAIKLLQQSDQPERAFELQARVAVAVNRRELTPQEAGIMLPGSAPNQTR